MSIAALSLAPRRGKTRKEIAMKQRISLLALAALTLSGAAALAQTQYQAPSQTQMTPQAPSTSTMPPPSSTTCRRQLDTTHGAGPRCDGPGRADDAARTGRHHADTGAGRQRNQGRLDHRAGTSGRHACGTARKRGTRWRSGQERRLPQRSVAARLRASGAGRSHDRRWRSWVAARRRDPARAWPASARIGTELSGWSGRRNADPDQARPFRVDAPTAGMWKESRG